MSNDWICRPAVFGHHQLQRTAALETDPTSGILFRLNEIDEIISILQGLKVAKYDNRLP